MPDGPNVAERGTAARGTDGDARGTEGGRTTESKPRRIVVEPPMGTPGSYVSPTNRPEVGTYMHKLLLRVLSIRLWAIGVPNRHEIESPRGSKKVKSDEKGKVDLGVFGTSYPEQAMWDAHLYELKPFSPVNYRRYRSEVESYTEYFPPEVSIRHLVYRVKRALVGRLLGPIEQFRPQVFEPVVLTTPLVEIVIRILVAKDSAGAPLDGVVYYAWGWRSRRRDETSNVQRVAEMLKVRVRQTAAAQAHGQARMAIIAGGIIADLEALGWLAVMMGVGAPLLTGGVVAPASMGIAGLALTTVEGLLAAEVANDIVALAAGIAVAVHAQARTQ